MACGPCAKKAAARKAALVSQQQKAIQPLAEGYVRKKYTGKPGNILSVRDGSYGFRNTGDVIVILEEDYLANKEVWADA